MGGRLVLAQITSKGEKRTGKIGTWFLNKFNSVDFLNEEYFNDFAERNKLFPNKVETIESHENYDHDGCSFAPYYYGILIFDFRDKKVFSCNNYNGFLLFGSANVCNEYEQIGFKKQVYIPINDFKGNTIREESIYEENCLNIKTPRLIDSCIRNNAKLYMNQINLTYNSSDDFFSIAARIYKKNLSELSKEEFDLFMKKKRSEGRNEINWTDWVNMNIEVPGWEIINGDGTKNYLRSALTYYQNTNHLTDFEVDIWEKEINKASETDDE